MSAITIQYNGDNIFVSSDMGNEDTTLIELFARFIEMTRIMGYQAGSWERVIADYNEACKDTDWCLGDYDIFDWAMDVITEE